MFRIIDPSTLPPVPWKNGGGTTRELARADLDGALLWRLSIAEVAADGPFSRFDGLTRVLTVIAGNGIDLVMPDRTLPARLGQPVRFSGTDPVEGQLVDGPITDLNLIFDVSRIAGAVTLANGPLRLDIDAELTALLILGGLVTAGDSPVPPGCLVLGQSGPISLGPDAEALVITLRPVVPPSFCASPK